MPNPTFSFPKSEYLKHNALEIQPSVSTHLSSRQLDYFVWASYQIFRGNLIHKDKEDSSCLFYQGRLNVFRPLKSFHAKNSIVGWFDQTEEANYQKNKAAAWQITSQARHIYQAIIDFTMSDKKQIIKMIGSEACPKKHPTGIAKLTKTGNIATFKKLKVRSEMPIDIQKLQDLFHKKNWEEHYETKIQIFDLLTYCFIKKGQIVLPQIYTQYPTGRLYLPGISLQNVKKEIRRTVTSGFEYDIENCHYAILNQLGSKYKTQTPYITDYLSNKREWRESLAEETEFSTNEVKTILLSFIYGASMKKFGFFTSKQDEERQMFLYTTFGKDGVAKIANSKRFLGVYNEIQNCKEIIIDNHKNTYKFRGDVVYNAWDFYVKDNTKNQNFAHIIQGYESLFLKIILENINSEADLLQHDGLTLPQEEDFEKIQNKIFQETGFEVSFSCSKV